MKPRYADASIYRLSGEIVVSPGYLGPARFIQSGSDIETSSLDVHQAALALERALERSDLEARQSWAPLGTAPAQAHWGIKSVKEFQRRATSCSVSTGPTEISVMKMVPKKGGWTGVNPVTLPIETTPVELAIKVLDALGG